MSLYILLPIVFLFLVFVVGGYVWMFLNVMRTDPREQKYRQDLGHDDTLIPHKYKPRTSSIKEESSQKEQAYAEASFNEVATKYDEIPFFKISASHIADIIKKHKDKDDLTILDVACGTGNVVLECAACFTSAAFDAVDISEGMLAKAKENAAQQNFETVTFHLQDITQLNLEKKYDVITCSYALFFLPDAHEVLKRLVGMLKPEGIVIFTSFLAKAFSPSTQILIPLLQQYGSASAIAYDMHKWENLEQVKDIEYLCELAGLENIEITSKEIRYGMSVDEWWELMNNTGYKGMLMELTPEGYEEVKQAYYTAMFTHSDMDGEVELNADSYFVVISV